MSELNTPQFFFSEAQVLQRAFIVYGNLSDYYVTPSDCWLSFDRAIASHLKHMGYECVIFFDGTVEMECFDAQSAEIRRAKIKTKREEKEDKAREKRGGAAADEASRPADGGEGAGEGEAKAPKAGSGSLALMRIRKRNTAAAAGETGAKDKESGEIPLKFVENAEDVPGYLDKVIRCTEAKTAIVFCNCMSLMDPRRDDNRSVSMRDLASKMSRWYGLPAENENIAVMLFDVPRIVTLHNTLQAQQMWNFLFERAFSGEEPTRAVIRIGGANLDEIQYLLHDSLPAYISPKQLREINPDYTRQGIENAAQYLVQQSGGSLKALKMFINQQGPNAIDELMKRFGSAKEDSLEILRTTEGWEAVYGAVNKIISKDRMTRDDMTTQGAPPRYNDTNLRMAYPQVVGASKANLSMVLCGNPGTGKTTVVQHIATAFNQKGLLSSDRVVKVTRDDLVGQYIGETALKTKSRIDEAMGGVLFVDEAYSLYREGHEAGSGSRDFGIEAIDTLLEAISDRRGQISIILAGYPKDMQHFLTANPGLPRRFDGNIITIQDYKPDLLERIFLKALERMNRMSREDSFPEDIIFKVGAHLAGVPNGAGPMEPLAFAEKDRSDRESRTHSPLSIFFDNWYADRDRTSFGNAGSAEELAGHVMERARERTGVTDGEICIEQVDFGPDYQKLFTNRQPSIRDLDEQMRNVIGMQKVKDTLSRIVSYLQMARAQEKAKGPSAAMTAEPGHYLFIGNPGTGKTMISEKLGMALCSMGMIQRYKPVRRTGLDLINTVSTGGGIRRLKEELESYIGGVLVIDEAHQLCEPATGGAGSVVLKCLLDPMIEHRHDLCVVFCCYRTELKQLLAAEPGLARRISDVFVFEDYTPAEICQIFAIKAKAEGYTLGDGVLEAVEAAFVDMGSYQTGSLLENGSSAERMLKEIKVGMAMRMRDDLAAADGDFEEDSALYTVLREDVERAKQQMLASLLVKYEV